MVKFFQGEKTQNSLSFEGKTRFAQFPTAHELFQDFREMNNAETDMILSWQRQGSILFQVSKKL